MQRDPARDLDTLLGDPGYTPPARDLPALFERLVNADRDQQKIVGRVIARAGEAAVAPALAKLAAPGTRGRAALVALLGRLGDARASAALLDALGDGDALVRRRAASALGRLDADAASELALLDAYEKGDLPLKRAIAEALGKVGSAPACERLRADAETDPELCRRVANALTLIERRESRGVPSRIVLDRLLGERSLVLARCRAGLAELMAAELRGLGRPRVRSSSIVELPWSGTLGELLAARLPLEWGVEVELVRQPDLAEGILRTLGTDRVRRVLKAWTDGTPRFRLSFTERGHRRALAWKVASSLSRYAPELVNDSRGASWEVVVDERGTPASLVLAPRGFDDPRFAYRVRDVPAASHPTVAAALARVAGVRADDLIWDPFVGSGLELVERARLGPYRKLTGTDIDENALEAARANLDAAKVPATLSLADARTYNPGPVTLVITNPPMGRRLARDRSLAGLLERVLERASRALVPGGRLVWLCPLPELARQLAPGLRLDLVAGPSVDLGGFEVELQTLKKRTNGANPA